MKTINILFVLLLIILGVSSCKKEEVDPHVPPALEFKTGAGYTSADATVGMQDTLVIGITASITEDELMSFNVSYDYDASGSTTTFYNYALSASETQSYSHDTQIVTRNQAGTEEWIFTIVDRDGNITSKSITLTVQ